MAGAPARRQLGYHQQAAAAFVQGAGAPQVGGGAAGVGDLADQCGVPDQPKPDWGAGVAYGVGDQLADQEFGGDDQGFQAPGGQLAGGQGPGTGDQGGVGSKIPAGDLARVQGVGAGEQQCHVVGGALGQRGLEHRVTGGVQRAERLAQGSRQVAESDVDVPAAGFDEAVGVEGEQAAFGYLDLGGLEGQAAEAERRSAGQVEEACPAVGGDEGRCGVSGTGQVAAPGYRVVHRVQAGGADLAGCAVASLGGEEGNLVIELGEQFRGGQVDVGEGADGAAQPSHGRGGFDTVADHVADDQGHPGSGERDHVVPVAAHADPGLGGQVTDGDIHCRQVGQPLRQQVALQGQGGDPFPGVPAGVVDADRRARGQPFGQEQVIVVEWRRVAVAVEGGDAEGGATGGERCRDHRVHVELALPLGAGRVLRHPPVEVAFPLSAQLRPAGGQGERRW